MKIVDFKTEDLYKNSLWFVLNKKYRDDITLVRPTAAGPEPFINFSAYRMPNDCVVIGFPEPLKTVSAQGYFTIGDGVSEYISTQAYERIEHLINIQPPNDDLGTFVFTDSQPVPASLAWRCDVAYYGPAPFEDLDGNRINPTEDVNVLVEFEPIISLAGYSHLVYLRRKDFAAGRYEHLNNALTPYTAATLGECIKLIHEWHVVAGEPFNNSQDIANKARHFCIETGITEELISPYPDMQIARFLRRDKDARLKPSNAIGPRDSLLTFVGKNISHMSLASALSKHCQSETFIKEIAKEEQISIEKNKEALYTKLSGHPYPEDGVISQTYLDTFMGTVLLSWFSHFDRAIQISSALV